MNGYSEKKRRIPSIEFFRFAATCCVVTWHLFVVDKLRHGYLPVEFFFILSGIWLYSTYLNHQNDAYTAFQYTADRIKRIYPTYLIACCLYFVLAWEKLQSADGWLKALSELLLLRDSGGVFPHGIAYAFWYLSAMLIGGYFVYAMLEQFGMTMIRLICPAVVFGTYTYLFSLSESIEHWGPIGPFSIPLMRGIAGLCLGVCLRAAALHIEESGSPTIYGVVNALSILSPFGIITCLLSQAYLDRYCLIFFSAILLACLLERSWLNLAIKSTLWEHLGKYSMEMYMIHISVIEIWKRLPWKPYGPIEKSIYIITYLITVFIAAIVLKGLGKGLRKKEQGAQSPKDRKWILCIAMMVCLGWIACHQQIWSDIDNYYISMITNGLYSKSDIYAQYLHPLLCQAIFALHAILPSADCFSLLVRVALIGAGGWIAFLLAERVQHISVAYAGCGFLLVLALAGRIFESNYTITAACFAAVGFFAIVIALNAENGKRHLIVAGTFFFSMGFMLRKESALLVLPFLLLVLIVRSFDEGKPLKNGIISTLKVVTIPCLVVGMLLLTNTFFYKSPERVQDAYYNENRTALVDYPVKTWEEIQGQFSEISENDYTCIKKWIFADTEHMDGDFMHELAVQATNRPQLSAKSLIQANRTILKTVSSPQTMVFSIWIPTFFAALLLLPKKRNEMLELTLAIVGGYIIMLALALKGRFPERVCIAVCLPIISLLGSDLLQAVDQSGTKRPAIIISILVGVLLATTPILRQIDIQNELCLSLMANAPGEEYLYEYTEPSDVIYLCNSDDIGMLRKNKKLPSAAYMTHYVSYGDWAYGQHFHREYLERLGVPNPMEALLTREHTYLLRNDPELVLRYLQEHYSPDVLVIQEGEINGKAIWRFYIP